MEGLELMLSQAGGRDGFLHFASSPDRLLGLMAVSDWSTATTGTSRSRSTPPRAVAKRCKTELGLADGCTCGFSLQPLTRRRLLQPGERVGVPSPFVDLSSNVELTGAARLYRAASSDRRERG
jgi:hypothetical protein